MVELTFPALPPPVTAALAYSDPGPDSLHLPTIEFAFLVKSFAASSKVNDVAVAEVPADLES